MFEPNKKKCANWVASNDQSDHLTQSTRLGQTTGRAGVTATDVGAPAPDLDFACMISISLAERIA